MANHVHHLRVHRISLPMRVRFKHASAERRATENLVVELELGNGMVGYGEAIPRDYVSGETVDGAAECVRDLFVDPLLTCRPNSLSELLGFVTDLPYENEQGGAITSARAAVELALLDGYSKLFRRSLDEIAGWMGASMFRTPGSLETVRYSGVLSAGDVRQTRKRLRLQRWGLGLSDFKLKVGRDDDRAVLEDVTRRLGRRIEAGAASVRVDANCAWTPAEARAWIEQMADLPVASLEQPMARRDDEFLPGLRGLGIPIMVDESLVTPADAGRLIDAGAVDLFNLRVSKNGGLIAALRLAERAASAGLGFQLGCMVGETGILSAAGRWFLTLVRGVKFAEGSFGKLLLADDVTKPSPRFRRGGRAGAMPGFGLGVEVDSEKLKRYAVADAIDVQL